MNRDFFPSQDFNQMLVASVFFHLMFLTAWMFLPKTKVPNEIIVPTFMVSLEEIPGGPEEGPDKPAGETGLASEIEPLAPPVETELQEPVDQKPEVPPPIMKESKKIPTAKPPVSSPPKTAARKSETSLLMEELDLLAKGTSPKKTAPVKKIVKSPIAIQEKTIGEKIETLKPLSPEKFTGLPDITLPDKLVGGLKKIEAIQIPESVRDPLKLQPEREQEPLKYAKLSELSKSQADSGVSGLDYEDLLKDLDVLKKTKTTSPISIKGRSQLKIVKSEIKPVPVEPPEPAESFPETLATITRKILIPEKSETIEIAISPTPEISPKNILSRIRTAKTPSTLAVSKPSKGGASGLMGGSSNPLALYKGAVKLKIDSNWKIPLGIEHKKEIRVAFFIFSEGNIEKPQLKTSSGDDQLDTMAIKAILDSVPFPKFSKELIDYLKEPNLYITMRFKLKPNQKNEKPN